MVLTQKAFKEKLRVWEGVYVYFVIRCLTLQQPLQHFPNQRLYKVRHVPRLVLVEMKHIQFQLTLYLYILPCGRRATEYQVQKHVYFGFSHMTSSDN